MNAQVYSVLVQTEEKRKTLLEWKSMDLSYELSLTCGGNVNYYKTIHHPISTVRIGNILEIFKINQLALFLI